MNDWLKIVCLLVSLLAVANVQAAPPNFCALPLFESEFVAGLNKNVLPNLGEYELLGDELTQPDSQTFELMGNASIKYENKILYSERLSFDLTQSIASSQSALRFAQNDVQITGDNAVINWLSHTAAVKNVRYYLPQSSASGQARAFHIDQANFRLEHATYSTCNPEQLGWRIRASQINLNNNTYWGSAKHVRLEIGPVPVFYLPYVSFATQGRKTGFLPPQFSNSSASGFGLASPFYWNIAANRDATITPRWLSKRGLLFENELRYMGERHRGQVQVEFLSKDALRASDRSLYALKHAAQVGRRIDWRVNVAEVSDIYYFRDFGNSLDNVSRSYLDRQVSLRMGGDSWALSGLLQDFQVLETNIDQPYRRLPQINLYSEQRYRYFEVFQVSEYSLFSLPNGLRSQRLVFSPALTLPLRRRWMHWQPQLFAHISQYWGDEVGAGSRRLIPGFSLDSGLVFEKKSKTNLQLLKPRFFYLYIPDRNQQDLPMFDSRVADFQYAQLFSRQRYIGNDRLGAAHRMTLALDSHWLTMGGVERMSLGVAQTYYLADQTANFDTESTISAGSLQSAAYSRLFLASDISAEANILLLSEKIQAEKGSFRLNYAGKAASASLGYRYRNLLGGQVSTSVVVDLTRPWSLSGRLKYSIDTQQVQEAYLGAEYNACCWSVRAVASRYTNRQGETDTGVALQIELKGLTSIGSRLEDKFSFTRL